MPCFSPFASLTASGEDDRLRLVRLLLNDRDWRCPPSARQPLLRILAGAADAGEAAWLALAEETARYLDFLRMAQLEAQLRGCPRASLRFTRGDWEHACATDAPSACIGEFHGRRPRKAARGNAHR